MNDWCYLSKCWCKIINYCGHDLMRYMGMTSEGEDLVVWWDCESLNDSTSADCWVNFICLHAHLGQPSHSLHFSIIFIVIFTFCLTLKLTCSFLWFFLNTLFALIISSLCFSTQCTPALRLVMEGGWPQCILRESKDQYNFKPCYTWRWGGGWPLNWIQ